MPWVCRECREIVEPRDVTYEETHDVRSGGCGESVEWLEDNEVDEVFKGAE